jgi:hypothetical protein
MPIIHNSTWNALKRNLDENKEDILFEDTYNLNENENFKDLQDEHNMTLLMYAVDKNRVEIVRFLKKKGADITLENNEGYTALKIAELKLEKENNSIISKDALKKIIRILNGYDVECTGRCTMSGGKRKSKRKRKKATKNKKKKSRKNRSKKN